MNGEEEMEEVAKVFLHSRVEFTAMPLKFCCGCQVPWNNYSKMNSEKAPSPVLDHTMCLRDAFLWVKLICSCCLAHRQSWYRQPRVSASSLIAHTVPPYIAIDKCANTVCLDIQSVLWYVPAKHRLSLCTQKRCLLTVQIYEFKLVKRGHSANAIKFSQVTCSVLWNLVNQFRIPSDLG